jgi:hypothetical protein
VAAKALVLRRAKNPGARQNANADEKYSDPHVSPKSR